MTFDQVMVLGGFVAAIIAGLLGIKRGEGERKREEQMLPFGQVMPTYADNARLDRQYEATLRLADAQERIADSLEDYMKRQSEQDRDIERSQALNIADKLKRLTEVLEASEVRRTNARPKG